tara:strand:- start:362 stop:1036 length:675 start_codon:yes stop_codon:yes gene_type:complete
MSNEFNLNVNKRDLMNKGGRRRALKEGKVPGVYYSHDSKDSIPFYIETTELNKAQKADTQIFNISVGSKKRTVLFKSIQYHPVTDDIMHIDLYGIKMDQMVSVSVTLNITGSAKGVVEGGILVQSLNEIELECLPADIPSNIDIDITHLDMGDSLRCSDVELDEKLIMKTAEEQIIISVTHPMKEEETVPVVDEDGLEGDEDLSDDSEESTDSETDSEDSKTEG